VLHNYRLLRLAPLNILGGFARNSEGLKDETILSDDVVLFIEIATALNLLSNGPVGSLGVRERRREHVLLQASPDGVPSVLEVNLILRVEGPV
jgi:hypothetical protein